MSLQAREAMAKANPQSIAISLFNEKEGFSLKAVSYNKQAKS